MSFGIGLGDIVKLCETAQKVYRNCRDSPGEYKVLASEARTLTNVLEDIADKVEQNAIPEKKKPQLLDAYESCVEVLKELDAILTHYNSLDTRSKRAWDRLKWDSEKSRLLRQKLTSSVVMMNGFWNSLIHDNQVLILEALGRLEKDYAGGHREESLASVGRITAGGADDSDDEEDAEAWGQIIRDLEDVGVSQQDALEYRDFIIDWFVRAVNEGRLMESSAEYNLLESSAQQQSFDTLQQDLEMALPVPPTTVHRMPSWETPAFPPPVIKRRPIPTSSQSTPAQPDPSTSSAERVESATRPQIHAMLSEPVLTPARSRTSSLTPSIREPVSSSSDGPSPPPAHPPPPPPPPPGMEYVLRPVSSNSSIPTPQTTEDSGRQSTSSSQRGVGLPPVPALQPSTTPPMVQQAPSPQATPAQPSQMPPAHAPPSYEQLQTSSDGNLIWTAQRVMAAWNSQNFNEAEKHLENQLAAVERGETITIRNVVGQPDRRLLRHLIGICASYTGKFLKAKHFFESIFNGIYLNGANLDEADIAAARWLGDVCLHLNEPENCALAWAVALDGAIEHYSIARDITRRIFEELRALDMRLKALQSLADSFRKFNTDCSDIFMSVHAMEKSRLVTSIQARMKQIAVAPAPTRSLQPSVISHQPPYGQMASFRPRTEWKVAEAFLVSPLIMQGYWPLPWDHTFSAFDAINLQKNMTTSMYPFSSSQGFSYDGLKTVSFMHSKELHYITRRNIKWLVQAVESGLQEMDIEYHEHGTMILCRISQVRSGMTFYCGIGIEFRKLQLRSMWGLKVTEVQHATRGIPTIAPNHSMRLVIQKDTEGFRDMVKGILEAKETEERAKELDEVVGGSGSSKAAEAYAAHQNSRGSAEKVSYG